MNIKIKIIFVIHAMGGFVFLGLVGCVSINKNHKPINEASFRGSMDQVWMATEKVLANYPISESNRESGIITTDYLRGPQCWKSPTKNESYSAGVRCSLNLQIVKVPHSGIKVRINKTLQLARDFISEPEELPNDGMEEVNILYRIDRELTIAKELLIYQKAPTN